MIPSSRATRRPAHLGPLDLTLHMIIARHRNGAFAAERDVGDLGLESTIADIMAGQVEDVERVIAFNPTEAWSRDATEDIAIEIAHRVGQTTGPIQPALRDFIETHAGPDFARGLAVVERVFTAA
jgi:hypothetical protein